MEILGNAQDARLISDFIRAVPERKYGNKGAPNGWEFLGYGSFRSAWRSPDGVCYKVEHYYSDYESDNGCEYQNWRKWCKYELPEGVRIPSLTYYENNGRPVVAMECVKGRTLSQWASDNCLPFNDGTYLEYRSLMREAGRVVGSADMHVENVMIDEDTQDLVIVDLQM